MKIAFRVTVAFCLCSRMTDKKMLLHIP